MNKEEIQKRVSQIVDWNKKPARPTIKYYSRLNVFKSCNLHFDPTEMKATSYRWYNIIQKINGVVYLNTYSYSSSTCKHYNKLWSLLNELKIKFKTIESPKGLQDLQSSVNHYVYQIAKIVVKSKYGRLRYDVSKHKQTLNELKKLGYTYKKELLDGYIKSIEENRISRLLNEQKKRIDKKIIAIAGNNAIL